jgi:hypothetical protein
VAQALEGLGCLGGHAEPAPRREPVHVIVGEDDVEFGEILGQPAHFHVPWRPDDDRMETLRDQGRNGAVCRADERAGGIDDVQAAFAQDASSPLGRPVRCDRHPRRVHVFDLVPKPDAAAGELLEHTLVVHQFSENAEALPFACPEDLPDGVAHAETHAQVPGSHHFHGVTSRRNSSTSLVGLCTAK